MPRRRFKQVRSLEIRLAAEAQRLRDMARSLAPGAIREETLRKARQAETGLQVCAWLNSSGLQPPK